jgi:hypothetical protein
MDISMILIILIAVSVTKNVSNVPKLVQNVLYVRVIGYWPRNAYVQTANMMME